MTLEEAANVVNDLLSKRAGRFSPLKPIFDPWREQLELATGLQGRSLREVIYNAQNKIYGQGKCVVCSKPTNLYEDRGGWATYCSRKCMNDINSPRTKKANSTRDDRDTGFGSLSVREKSAITMLERYGADNPSKVESIVKKKELNSLSKFGVKHPISNVDIRQRIEMSLKKNHNGIGWGSKEIRDKVAKTQRLTTLNQLISNNSEWVLLTDSSSWAGCKASPITAQHNCGKTEEFWLWSGSKSVTLRCSTCHGSSIPQQKIINLLSSIGCEFIVNDRKIISPLELDIVIPHHKIAIEVNGLYYHGELSGKKDKKYHLNKTLKAGAKEYQLIHITDFDILHKWSAVENMILAKLHMLPKIGARTTKISAISNKAAKEFLNTYHLQGYCRTSKSYGLFKDEILVAVMTFGKSRFNKTADFELLRFAASATVMGGASKLLTAFRKEHAGTIISYADRRWSQGQLYKSLGFSFESETPPSYWYFKKNGNSGTYHRSLYQRHKLQDNSTSTEWEIMQSRGWDRIWDCGSLRFKI